MEPATITTDTMAIADALRPTFLRVGRELRREARDAGISPEQVAILVSIRNEPGVCAGSLAAGERVSPPAMSKLLARLERDGLIERTPSENDRRRVGLRLTTEGNRLLRRVRSRRTAWLANRLGALSPDDLAAVEAAVEPLSRLLDQGEGRA
jgi:DNA-binding MarR family transcriptional regulator